MIRDQWIFIYGIFMGLLGGLLLSFGLNSPAQDPHKINDLKTQTSMSHIDDKKLEKTQEALERAREVFPNTKWKGADVSNISSKYIKLMTENKTASFYYDPDKDVFLIGMLINPNNKAAKYAEGVSQ